MRRYKIRIGDLVVIKGHERDYGVGIVMNTITNGFNGQTDVRVLLNDKECWFPSFTLRKVTYESG